MNSELYDLKWIEALETKAHKEVTELDIFDALMGAKDEVILFNIDLNFETHTARRLFISDPVSFLVRKINTAEVNMKRLTPPGQALFRFARK